MKRLVRKKEGGRGMRAEKENRTAKDLSVSLLAEKKRRGNCGGPLIKGAGESPKRKKKGEKKEKKRKEKKRKEKKRNKGSSFLWL